MILFNSIMGPSILAIPWTIAQVGGCPRGSCTCETVSEVSPLLLTDRVGCRAYHLGAGRTSDAARGIPAGKSWSLCYPTLHLIYQVAHTSYNGLVA